MNLRTAVIVATKDRPQEVANLLNALARQTVAPDQIVVSACSQQDIPPGDIIGDNVEVLLGTPGSSVQRNRGLSRVRGKADVIVFFDDDFVPSRYWIEHVRAILATHTDVACVTGQVLLDGVSRGGLAWQDAQALVDKEDQRRTGTVDDYRVLDHRSPYGCNMAFRASRVETLTFDERLVLYGWLEDRDFAFRAGQRITWTDAVWGVHLGATRGRPSGLRYGYSQVVNPWYLGRKGTMTAADASVAILRVLGRNAIGSFLHDPFIDRRGRFKGNMTAVTDILFGRGAPENAARL
jgi:glycosyltransferase involved in cell wall biosynthesis